MVGAINESGATRPASPGENSAPDPAYDVFRVTDVRLADIVGKRIAVSGVAWGLPPEQRKPNFPAIERFRTVTAYGIDGGNYCWFGYSDGSRESVISYDYVAIARNSE